MHARHVTFRTKAGRAKDAVAIFENAALPLLRDQEGFQGACMLMDPTSGEGVIMILWKEAHHSRRLEAAGFYQQQIARFADVFVEPPRPVLFEVANWSFDSRPSD